MCSWRRSLLSRSCRDRFLEDKVVDVMAQPFDHLGVVRFAGDKAARAGDEAEEVELLGEVEGDRNRFPGIGRTNHRGRTIIASYREDPHCRHPLAPRSTKRRLSVS